MKESAKFPGRNAGYAGSRGGLIGVLGSVTGCELRV